MKSGFVTIIGRPSTGKSTLLNSISGHKISITSTTPQTTRNKIKGIFTNPLGQIIFIDTPGFHLSTKKFNLEMMNNVYSSLKDAELILYIIDIQDEPGSEEKEVLKIIKNSKIPFLVIINKIDIEKNKEKEIMEFLKENETPPSNIIKISGEKKINLEKFINKVFEYLEDGPLYYPEEYYTDQEMGFRISEIIREEVIRRLKDELPYSIYVEIDTIEDRENLLFVKADIMVLRESQKGIIVGKGGEGIKTIGEAARKTISAIFEKKCNLFLQVKTKNKWNKQDKLIKKITG